MTRIIPGKGSIEAEGHTDEGWRRSVGQGNHGLTLGFTGNGRKEITQAFACYETLRTILPLSAAVKERVVWVVTVRRRDHDNQRKTQPAVQAEALRPRPETGSEAPDGVFSRFSPFSPILRKS